MSEPEYDYEYTYGYENKSTNRNQDSLNILDISPEGLEYFNRLIHELNIEERKKDGV
jgi:hypothetical protein